MEFRPAPAFREAAITGEALTILHDVYWYNGATTLKTRTEENGRVARSHSSAYENGS
jgi:hypothetical protein